MSWIANSTRPGAELAQLGLGVEAQGGFPAPSGSSVLPPWAQMGDTIFGSTGGGAQQPFGALGDAGGLGGAMSGFFGLVSNLFSQIQQYLTQSLGSGGSSGASAAQPSQAGQTFYNSASASSVGDPHEAFNGTTGAGNTVNGKWDSMRSHRDLLDSDSFNGGYRVSTQTTQPNSSGVTLNQSGTVTTASGSTTVTLNANGRYAVTSYGQNIGLQQGQSVSLGNGESVTLNADNSLTVNDSNAQGGSITTTLAQNGSGGVDVTSNANAVDLGGYLANRSDGQSGAWPSRQAVAAASQPGFAPHFATLPQQQANQFASGAGSYGSWGDDALLAEQNVDPLLAG